MMTRRVWVAVAGVLLAVAAPPLPALRAQVAGAQSGDHLFGYLDSVTAPDPLAIQLRGWVVDPGDATPQPEVTVTVQRPDGTVTTTPTGPADRLRPDVGFTVFHRDGEPPFAVCPRLCGDRDFHGFIIVLTDQPAGPATVCIDATLGAVTSRIGCQDIRVAWPSLHDPVGRLTGVSVAAGPAGPQVTVTGWAWDRDDTSRLLTVHVYALQYKAWGSPYLGGDRDLCVGGLFQCFGGGIVPALDGKDTVANLAEPVGDDLHGHGFTHTVVDQDYKAYSPFPSAALPLNAGMPTRVCAIAENYGPGRDHLLGCQWVLP